MLEPLLGIGLPAETETDLERAYESGGLAGLLMSLLEFQADRSGKPCTDLVRYGAVANVTGGRYDEALQCLKLECREHSLPSGVLLKQNPTWDPLRDAPASRRSWRGWGWRTDWASDHEC